MRNFRGLTQELLINHNLCNKYTQLANSLQKELHSYYATYLIVTITNKTYILAQSAHCTYKLEILSATSNASLQCY